MPSIHVSIVVISNFGLLCRNNLFIFVDILIDQDVDFHEVTDVIRNENQLTQFNLPFNLFKELHELFRIVSDQVVTVINYDN